MATLAAQSTNVPSPELLRELRRLQTRARRDPAAALAPSDPRALPPPDTGIIEGDGAGPGDMLSLDASGAAARKLCARQSTSAPEKQRRTLAPLRVDLIQIGTEGSFAETVLFSFLARARSW